MNRMIADAFLICRRMFLAVFVLFIAVTSSATSYVTLNDGRLLVFPDECVQSVIQEDGFLTIIALDGSAFTFSMEVIMSIDEELTKELPAIISYKFNNKYNYQVFTDADGVINGDTIGVEVAGIGKRLTASFSLSDTNASAFVDGVKQHSKESRLRFDAPRIYTVGYEGDQILKRLESGECVLLPFGREYVVNVDFLTDHATSVPRIDINTVGGVNITSKTVYVDAEIIIDGAGVFPSMTDSVKIKGRGNDSWSSDPNSKNPYRLKFASKVKPFGLTKGKNWVLLANKRYGSMLTNAYGMKVAGLLGATAANHIIPVDLYINGTYKGSYNFTEKVGLAGNSVDLDDESAAALLELDKYYDEAISQKFRSAEYNAPVNVKSPEFGEDETLLTLEMIKDRYNNFETAVAGNGNIADHIDFDAFARFLMTNEYVFNPEIFHPKSTFLYNENIISDSCKFVFGPVWDLDWGYGYNGTHGATYFTRYATTSIFNVPLSYYTFFKNIYKDYRVKQIIYELWKEFMDEGLDELCEFCQEYYDYAAPSIANNKAAGLDSFNYSKQINNAVTWFRQRANFLLSKLEKELFTLGDVDYDGVVTIADVSSLIDYLLDNSIEEFNMVNADVDGDGDVTIGDVSALIDILLAMD